mmetsp:Transcript_112660/g.230588  ORF Transcript_112660/g.230588 Transcript_112660/m.230588 type:complete len:268 (+) Transcript_112660:72-875(+)
MMFNYTTFCSSFNELVRWPRIRWKAKLQQQTEGSLRYVIGKPRARAVIPGDSFSLGNVLRSNQQNLISAGDQLGVFVCGVREPFVDWNNRVRECDITFLLTILYFEGGRPRQDPAQGVGNVPTPFFTKGSLRSFRRFEHQSFQGIPHAPVRKATCRQCFAGFFFGALCEDLQSQRGSQEDGVAGHAEFGVDVVVVVRSGGQKGSGHVLGTEVYIGRSEIGTVRCPSAGFPRFDPFLFGPDGIDVVAVGCGSGEFFLGRMHRHQGCGR